MKKFVKFFSLALALISSVIFLSCAGAPTTSDNSSNDSTAPDSTGTTQERYVESVDLSFDKIKCCNVKIQKNTNAEFIYGEADNWSIHYLPNGNWTFIKFEDSAEIDWSNVRVFSFWVYNPSDNYDVNFSVSLSKNMNLDFEASSVALGKATEKAEYGWTKIEIAGNIIRSAVADGYIYLSIGLNYTVNGETASSEQWKNTNFYIDHFEVTRN